jgi:hypothetical protein
MVQVLGQLLRDRARAPHGGAAPQVDLDGRADLLDVDALVLPEQIVFGGQDGALEVR